ncbi:hypothetical protein QOZ80_7BG0583910 [Eleusine coracana subsp. coracana]|nr:hypothetical protein QOZ80_7BG0583910 [Eleusine coracana subsp. coracana]
MQWLQEKRMSGGLKRKARELGEQSLSAAVGEVAARTVSAAVGRYDAQATVDDQLEHLAILLVTVHSAVEARAHPRLVAPPQAVSTLWNAARCVLRSAKSVLMFAVAGDEDVERLSRMVARVERVATGIGDFLKLIEPEIRMSLLPSQRPPSPPSIPPPRISTTTGTFVSGSWSPPVSPSLRRPPRRASAWCATDRHEKDDMFPISHEEYTAGRRRVLLLVARRNIRRAIHMFIRAATTAAPCFQQEPPDAGKLRALVSDIRDVLAASDKQPEVVHVHGRRCWLAEWRRELQAVADRADCVLLRLAAPDNDDDGVRRTVESVEKAAAHLGDFVTALRIYGLST